MPQPDAESAEAIPTALPTVVESAKPDVMEMDERGLYRMRNQSDEVRMAKLLLRTGAVPQTFREPEQVVMAIQALKSLGLNWRTALRQCGFNQQGAFIVYGDLELAVVRQSGLLEDIHEYLVVRNEDGTFAERCMANNNIDKEAHAAVCMMQRKGTSRAHEATFSVEDAKTSGLWGKTPTWRQYPSRMMQMRARGLAIRNCFSDVTQGLGGHEYDVEGVDYGKN